MPAFGRVSQNRLRTCDPRLRALFELIVIDRDCTILVGHRGETAQNRAFETKRSKLAWPDSKHNSYPSLAVDVAPWPVPDWDDREAFVRFGSYVQGRAEAIGLDLRWGGDWDGDGSGSDQTFDDLVHFELIDD